ncbi:hypothetical protein BGX33_002453 [Mortierella sp. NVP41]|nr:hypothetical protein BGX33_002453 [Mortierella sp. NVP41]
MAEPTDPNVSQGCIKECPEKYEFVCGKSKAEPEQSYTHICRLNNANCSRPDNDKIAVLSIAAGCRVAAKEVNPVCYKFQEGNLRGSVGFKNPYQFNLFKLEHPEKVFESMPVDNSKCSFPPNPSPASDP